MSGPRAQLSMESGHSARWLVTFLALTCTQEFVLHNGHQMQLPCLRRCPSGLLPAFHPLLPVAQPRCAVPPGSQGHALAPHGSQGGCSGFLRVAPGLVPVHERELVVAATSNPGEDVVAQWG